MIREIVLIDEDKCDGCGVCIPACHEGALRLVNGKARLVSDRYCDGLGACLGHCPRGAITVERREADEFDEQAVAARLHTPVEVSSAAQRPLPLEAEHFAAPMAAASECGCPGARFQQFAAPRGAGREAVASPCSSVAPPAPRSELTHWPVQLHLLPPGAPILRGAALLVAADCVSVAYAEFHQRLLRGRAVLIGCPKLDDLDAYVEKLAAVIRLNELREIVVARMEVPCCRGIVVGVVEARRRAGSQVRVSEVVVGTRGDKLSEREIPVEVSV